MIVPLAPGDQPPGRRHFAILELNFVIYLKLSSLTAIMFP